MTYESLAKLPDWSGWWTTVAGPLTPQLFTDHMNLYQPDASRKLKANSVPGTNISSSGVYCQPARFVGDNGGAIEDFEFLFTPGRLTITNESGLLRRIDLDGRPLRESPEESNAGTSIGHWEGQTLVVETIAVNSKALFPGPNPASIPIGKDVHIVERLTLNDRQELVIDTVLEAPQLLTAPLQVKRRYKREIGHVVRDHDICSDEDRSIDPVSGLQRFDLTPPADLPPPPPLEKE
jgi:hypothetical protein